MKTLVLIASALLAASAGAWALDAREPLSWLHMAGAAALTVAVAFAAGTLFIYLLNRQLRREIVRRREIETELDEERARLGAIFDNAGVGVALADKEACYVDVNRRWCAMFGYSPDEVRGKLRTHDLSHPDDVAPALACFRALIAGDIPSCTLENRFVRKDGSIFWGVVATTVIRDGDGHCKWMVDVVTDIDERKRIEEALHENEERLRFITENTHDVVWQLDRKLCFTYVSGADERMRGYSRDDVIGHHINELLTPKGVETVRELTAGRMAQEARGELTGVLRFETQMICKGGGLLWTEVSSTPLRDSAGRIVGYAGVTRETTERHEAEEQLRHTLADLPIALSEVSANGSVTYLNRRFHALFGYTHDEVPEIGYWLELAYPDPDYRAMVLQGIETMVASARRTGRGAGPAEYRVRCKDGSVKDIEFYYVDFVRRGIWTMSDVTERNRVEQALIGANKHMHEQLKENRVLEEKLREQSIRDPLTGLYNRRYLDESLARELSRSMRDGYPLSVLMIDIDHFKRLNDTYGHQAGDEVLKGLGALVRDGARIGDLPCRYGGEEFMLVLPNMPLDAAAERAEQWRAEFEQQRVTFGKFSLAATLSIGVAAFPEHGGMRDELIEAADHALYAAKHDGRNRVAVAPVAGQPVG